MNDTLAPPRKRRRFLRFALVLLGFLLLLVGFAPQIISKTPLKDWVVAKLLGGMQAKYSVSEVSLSWFGPVEIQNLRINVQHDEPALIVPRATVEKTLLQLLMNTRDVGTITLHEPTLWVLTEGKTTNVEQAIAKYLEDDGSPSKPERFAIDLKVVNGALKLSEAKTPNEQTQHTFQLQLLMPKARTEPIRLTLDLDGRTAKPGTLKLDAQFAPVQTLGVNAQAFDLSQLSPILPRFAAGTSAKGTLTSALTFQWGEKGTTLNGKADVAALELAAPWLGSDRLALDSIAVDSEVTQDGGVVKAKKLNVVCDVGHASFSGEVDPTADTQAMLARTGITLDAQLDLAKLAAKIPGVLRIREGVEIREGSVTAQLHSHPGEHGPAWKGMVKTSHLAGSNQGKPIEWKDALDVRFDLSFLPGRVPFFEQFEVRSDFLRMAAKGELEHFVSAAEIDLQMLTDHLDDFLDLGYTFAGTANVKLNNLRDGAGGTQVDGTAKLLNFTMVDAAGVGVREKQLDVDLKAAGKKGENTYRIDTAIASILSGEDRFEVSLQSPIPDVRKWGSGAATLKLQGDFARWVARVGPMIDWPAAWQLAGTGTLTARVQMEESKFACDSFALDMKDARFQGAGLNVNEPTLTVNAKGEYDRKGKAVILNDVNVSCNTVGASAKKLELRPAANGQYGLAGDVNLQAQVGRLMHTLNIAAEMDGLAKGKATFDAGTPGQVAFDADLKVENFRYGPAAKPTWSEPWITLQTQGKYSGDAIAITSTKLARDGFAAEGQGKIGDLAGATNVDVKGTLTYDLAKLEPQLKAYLGKTGQATGTGTKPFQLNGNLSNGGQNLAVNVGNDLPGSVKRDPLAGNAALEWQSLKAYGFDVGKAELKADLRDNAVKMSPVEATFGGGKIRVEPTLQLNKDYDLSFNKGTIIQKAKLTPAACSEAIGYALPLLANVADASGTISFDLAENRIPLTDPGMGTLCGTLTIHEAEVSPNDLITQIAGLFTQKALKLRLADENKVPIRMEKGRVHHENLTLTIDGVTIRSSGSVGVFDSTLDLVIQIPLQGKLAEAMVPANRPLIREAVGKQTIRIAVKGTMGKPLADREAFRTAMGKVIQDATKDAAAGAADDLIKKGLEGLFQKKP